MNLAEYFQNTSGIGILSTANSSGEVDAAIFATPHVTGEREVAFIMRNRLTHKNLQSNPFALYMFIENDGFYKGSRLFLKKNREDTDPKLLKAMSRRHLPPDEDRARGPKSIVFFEVTRILPLVGTGEEQLTT